MRVVIVSLEDQEKAEASQADYPHLTVVADTKRRMAEAFEVIHPRSGPSGSDTAAPTTILVDGTGRVRWTFRPERHIVRLPVEELLAVVDEHLRIEWDALRVKQSRRK